MSLKYGILGLLNYSPMTGYNMKKLFDKSVNHIWTASISQIYRELGVLEKGGFVKSCIEEQEDRPDKRVYRITDEGKKAFSEWLAVPTDAFISPKRDEFMLRMFFGAALGREEVKKNLERFVENRKQAVTSLDEDQKTVSKFSKSVLKDGSDLKEEKLYMQFIVKRAQMTNKMLIQWAEECISELENK